MKPTNDGQWAHVVCALFVPEVFFEDPEGREGIDCSKVAPRRWEGKCYVCDSGKGCVLDCSELKCHLGFHVTCGLKEDLCLEYKEGKRTGAIVAGFCKDHTELWKKVYIYIYQIYMLIIFSGVLVYELKFILMLINMVSPYGSCFLQQQQTGKFKIVAREEHSGQ